MEKSMKTKKEVPLPKCIADLDLEALKKCIVIEQKTVREQMALLPHCNIGEQHPWAVSIRVEIDTSSKENDSSSGSQENTSTKVENYVIQKFVTPQVRELCLKLGITQASRMSKLHVGFAIGLVVSSNPKGPESDESNQLRYNTLILMMNILFSDQYVVRYLGTNDSKTRADIERGDGGKNQWLWRSLVETMREFADKHKVTENFDSDSSTDGDDTDDDDERRKVGIVETNDTLDGYGIIDKFENNMFYDEYIKVHYVKEKVMKTFDLTSCMSNIDSEMVKDWTILIQKTKAVITTRYGVSGTHDPDAWNYIEKALQDTKSTNLIGKFPLYYYFLKSSSIPDFDKKFAVSMSEELKGCSESNVTVETTRRKNSGPPEGIWVSMAQALQSISSNNKSNDDDGAMAKKAKYESESRLAASNERLVLLNEIEKLETMIRKYEAGSEMHTKMQRRIDEITEKLFVA